MIFIKLWEEEEPHDGAVEDLVVVRLSSEMQVGREHVNIILTAGRSNEHFIKRDQGLSCDLPYLCLFLDHVMEHLSSRCLHIILVITTLVFTSFLGMGSRDVKPHLNKLISRLCLLIALAITWVVKLEGDLCLTGNVRVCDVLKGNLKRCPIRHEEREIWTWKTGSWRQYKCTGEGQTLKIGSTPIPSLERNFLGLDCDTKVLLHQRDQLVMLLL